MRLVVIVFFLSLAWHSHAQSFTKFSVGGSVHILASGSINTSSSNAFVVPGQTYSQYADSVSSYESMRATLGASVWVYLFLNKRWGFQGGISYVDVGFTRTQSNIQYLDPLYPGIGQGKLLEKSSGSGEKQIDYHYRYQYLQVPLLLNYELFNSKDFYYKISLSGGMGINFLVNHEIKANLSQFVVEGEDVFHLDSSGYEGKAVTLSFFLGAKGEYRYNKKTILYVMPLFGMYPISVSKTPMQVYPYYFQLNLGMQYAFTLKDEGSKK